MFKTLRRYDWKRAFSSTRKLLADKENTNHVFEIMHALRGDAMERGRARMRRCESGQRIMADRPDLVAALMDADRLRRLPEGTLGRVYIDFVTRENITADGLIEASETSGYDGLPEDVAYYGNRVRDMHDLWHIVTGYGRDGVGEACLVAFSYAQTRSLGFALIGLMAGWTFQKAFKDEPILRAVWRAYRDGCKAAWLPATEWEKLLDVPLDEVRARLNIPAPVTYRRAERAIAGTGLVAA